jgi:ribosomal-protein-alanine N-acetyltransferase
MSAVLKTQEAQFEPLSAARLSDVLAVENSAYTHPWTRGNFTDSMLQGYQMQLLSGIGAPGEASTILGYFVAMKGVDEVHLLNITVAPAWQRQGWARVMLDALAIWSRGQGAQWLWLEVRASNARAQQVYSSNGFKRVGLRKAYYPASGGVREDAVVMSLKL